MTNITETNTFPDNVQEYDLTDPVLGGNTGESNIPIIELTNRTRYLKNYINGYDGIKTVTGNATIDNSYAGKLTYINVTVNCTATLAATTAFILGQKISIKTKTTGIKSIKIVPTGADVIVGIPSPFTALWLHGNETIDLVYIAAGVWELIDIDSNLNQCGNDGMVRRLPKNAITADGTTSLARADFARLWDIVSGFTVSDALWLSDAVSYRQRFASGNGSTTFRLPDMRSMMWRGLDLGRGVSLTRLGSIPGDLELDIVKNHGHRVRSSFSGSSGIITADPVRSSLTGTPAGSNTDNNIGGGSENTVKNAGLTPIIYY